MGSDIDGEAPGDLSGHSVSLSADGSHVAIGAVGNNGNGSYSGHVRIYSWIGSSWVQMGNDINGKAFFDQSGYSVSLSADGSRVAIGAIYNDGSNPVKYNSGHVRVYSWNGSSWVQMGNDIDGEATSDQSGYSVSLSADGARIAIGANRNDGNGPDSGHVRVYSWNGSSWVQMGSDIDGETDINFSGYSVSLSADGTHVAIGAPINNGINGLYSGHVRIYSWIGSSWDLIGELDGDAFNDQSGYSVSLSADGTRIAIGAPQNDGNGSNSGHVRVYELSTPAPAPSATPTPVIINFNVTVDASSNLTVFGTVAPEVSNVIVPEIKLPVSALYDASTNKGLIEFWEPDSSENLIYCQLADSSLNENFSGAYNTTAKQLACGIQRLLCGRFDCSDAVPFNDSNKYSSAEYYKQRDFGRVALGAFAHDLFGHVDATAAITNDIGFIKSMLSITDDMYGDAAATQEYNEILSPNDNALARYTSWKHKSMVDASDVEEWDASKNASDANLAIAIVKKIIEKGIDSNGNLIPYQEVNSATDATNATLGNIVAQVLGQDATRMMNHDNSNRTKNVHQLLQFIPDDTIYVKIKLAVPSIDVGNGQQVSKTSLDSKSKEHTYTLKIVLGQRFIFE
jgi:hypothetical protein